MLTNNSKSISQFKNRLDINYPNLAKTTTSTYLPFYLNFDMSSPKGYRDPLYIIKDIILTLSEYGN